jgi:hypothetical protein
MDTDEFPVEILDVLSEAQIAASERAWSDCCIGRVGDH